ncbi:hypothetical protein B1A99_24765 [Cohnella sp. CIP 111063]|uniref:hypothetical protein n=1 Tax=unclassified Cohnella TaxID=2636738 RepID=UPI000B8C6603|nr:MULTISPECIES: hypothetical protein [unclassified Cohnella]OXS54996.1 hypothetical protein B1A99_24765 [Cohnella sp. CIP 111063]
MDRQAKQAILDVLNSLEVISHQDGEMANAFVRNTPENVAALNSVGISVETIKKHGDDEIFCIFSIAADLEIADYNRGEKLYLFGPVDDELRNRVIDGEGDAIDAERLLRLLEPELFD